jgi:hypothetical protein
LLSGDWSTCCDATNQWNGLGWLDLGLKALAGLDYFKDAAASWVVGNEASLLDQVELIFYGGARAQASRSIPTKF